MSNYWNQRAAAECRQLVELALAEDLGDLVPGGVDCTTAALVDPDRIGQACFVARDQGIVCGLMPAAVAAQGFSQQLVLDAHVADGDPVDAGLPLATIRGPAARILTAERTLLNFMGRLSGIASLTRRFVEQVEQVEQVAGTAAKILDTRKTTPAWRHLEKYAVRCGGATNHRTGLFDEILIKDNHLAFANTRSDDPIGWAVQRAREWIEQNQHQLPHGRDTIVHVEVDRLDQLRRALDLPVDVVLLDNMSASQLAEAVELRNQINPNMLLEASGGVHLETVAEIALSGVDRISCGALTHSATNFDIGLDWG